MGLIVQKDFNIGYNINSYMRIKKLDYSLKENKWNIIIEFYFSEETVKQKKIIEIMKKWILNNPDKINDNVWDYLNTNYFNKDQNLFPIGVETLNFDSLFTAWDFDSPEEIFNIIYDQIKYNPGILNIKKIIKDVIEDTEENLIAPIIIEIEKVIALSDKEDKKE